MDYPCYHNSQNLQIKTVLSSKKIARPQCRFLPVANFLTLGLPEVLVCTELGKLGSRNFHRLNRWHFRGSLAWLMPSTSWLSHGGFWNREPDHRSGKSISGGFGGVSVGRSVELPDLISGERTGRGDLERLWGNALLSSVKFVDGCRVWILGAGDFANCSSLRSVCIPAAVETIANICFLQCTSLSDLTFALGSKLSKLGDLRFGKVRHSSQFVFRVQLKQFTKSAPKIAQVLRFSGSKPAAKSRVFATV
jgi:hypothetical protein